MNIEHQDLCVPEKFRSVGAASCADEARLFARFLNVCPLEEVLWELDLQTEVLL